MSKFNRKSNKGFTLIELKAKSSEGKVNIAAIRTAEESYLAEFGSYVAAAVAPAAVPGTSKVPFVETAAVGADFNTLGWAPEGQVFFQYAVAINAAGAPAAFSASAAADIDGDGVGLATAQYWAYIKEIGTTAAGIQPVHGPCGTGGVWDAAAAAATALDTVGPCNAVSGQSVF